MIRHIVEGISDAVLVMFLFQIVTTETSINSLDVNVDFRDWTAIERRRWDTIHSGARELLKVYWEKGGFK